MRLAVDGGYADAMGAEVEGDCIRVRWMAGGSPGYDNKASLYQSEELNPALDKKRRQGSAKPQATLPTREKCDPLLTDLAYFRASLKDLRELPRGEFAVVKEIGTGLNGKIFRYTRLKGLDTCDVAVKQLRNEVLSRLEGTERDERTVHCYRSSAWSGSKQTIVEPDFEDSLTEIGVLQYLARQRDCPIFLLRLHDVFSGPDKQHTWLVTELADGGELFDVAASAQRPTAQQVVRYMWQLLVAVQYLHRHHIGHRDISLENILLKKDSVRLMDFAMSVHSHSRHGTESRFFRCVGKPMYRAPECYVNKSQQVSVLAPQNAKPNAVVTLNISGTISAVRLAAHCVPGRICEATPWGYAAQPADMFAVAVCIFMLSTGMPIFEQAQLADKNFAHLHTKGLEAVLANYRTTLPSPTLTKIVGKLLCSDPSQRPTASDVLSSSPFCNLKMDIQVHPKHEEDAASEENIIHAAFAGA